MKRAALLLTALCAACAGEPAGDSGVPDTGARTDSGLDAGQDAGEPDAAPDAGAPDSGPTDAEPADAGEEDAGIEGEQVLVVVTLDGAPVEGAVVLQGGSLTHTLTDARGWAVLTLDDTIVGDALIVASHPEAREGVGTPPATRPGRTTIELLRYDRSDYVDYRFQDPGEPDRRPTTAQCAHCHRTLSADWFPSPHRTSASNPTVQDLYAGAASAYASEAACVAAGGRWVDGRRPGGGRGMGCYKGDGLLPALNPFCTEAPCEGPLAERGECADCHAPGIDGDLGGRDLLEAEGLAYEYGVHCDVCHRVESVSPADPRPGVGGRLGLMRPSEPGSPALGAGGRLPLTFGPSHDSPNPRMGVVQRDHFREGALCAGCHQLDVQVKVPGQALDPNRWPQGVLPVQSTYLEWQAGALADAPCQSCHMPPAAERANGADLQLTGDAEAGIQGGWYRPPGAVRQHAWFGPRQPASRMLELAAAVFIQSQVANGTLTAEVTVKNVGAGHALPTGEPMRHLVLRVEARCGGVPLVATGGDVVPDFGGARAQRAAGEDRTRWPGAQSQDRLRVVNRLRGYHDYAGFGPFGDGTFGPAEKGMELEDFVGEVTITQVAPDGTVTTDAPLPDGALTYLVRGAEDHAGAPGFGFARVMRDAAGRRMVPHFVATDVVSDNRLMPQQGYTTTHRFAATCPDPVVEARLYHRPYATWLAEERGWANPSHLMTEARR